MAISRSRQAREYKIVMDARQITIESLKRTAVKDSLSKARKDVIIVDVTADRNKAVDKLKRRNKSFLITLGIAILEGLFLVLK